MVLTYGRRRAQKLNRGNEIGLKMSGCTSRVGRKPVLNMCIRRRAPCVTPPTPSEAIRILHNYFIQVFGRFAGVLILVGKQETLKSDGVNTHLDKIKHYHRTTPEYADLPWRIKMAVNVINNLGIMGSLAAGTPPVPHVVGWESWKGIGALRSAGYGNTIMIGNESVLMFSANTSLSWWDKSTTTPGKYQVLYDMFAISMSKVRDAINVGTINKYTGRGLGFSDGLSELFLSVTYYADNSSMTSCLPSPQLLCHYYDEIMDTTSSSATTPKYVEGLFNTWLYYFDRYITANEPNNCKSNFFNSKGHTNGKFVNLDQDEMNKLIGLFESTGGAKFVPSHQRSSSAPTWA
jgi:hypothetical protein